MKTVIQLNDDKNIAEVTLHHWPYEGKLAGFQN